VDVPDDQGTLPVKASPLRARPLLTHKQKENDRPKVSTVSSMGEVESSRTQAKNCSKDPTVGSYQQLRVKVLASKEDVEKPVLIEPVSSDVVITEKVKLETVECEKDSMDIVMTNGIKKQFTAVTPQSPSVSKMSDHPAQYLNTGNEVDVRQENHDSKKDAASFIDTVEEETVKQNDRPKVSTVSSMGEVESSRTQAKNCSKDPTVGSYQQLRVKVLASKEDVEKPVLIEPVSSDVVITEKVKLETVECEKDSMDIVMNNGTKKQFTAVTTQSPSVSKMSDHPAQYLNTGNEVDVRQENHDSKKDAASFTDTAEDETVSPALIQGLSVSRVEPIQQHQDTQSQDLASMCGNDSQSVGASGLRQEPLTPLEKARRKRSASRAIAGHVRMVTSTRYTSFQKSRRAPILSLFGGPNPVGVDVEERPSVDSETQSSLPNSKGNQERGEAYQEFVSAYRNYSRDRTSPAHYATRIQALDRLNAAKVKNRVPPAPRRIDGV
jgi:ribosome assembly protein YihI (activator of Der GTPase)